MSRTRITRTDVATLAKVSRTTVSFVVNDTAREHRIAEATIERVREAIRELGYAPRHHAQALAGRSSTRALGCCIDPLHPARRLILSTISRIARQHGWQAGLCGWSSTDHTRLQSDIDSRRYDALLCIGDWPFTADVPTLRWGINDGDIAWDLAEDCARLATGDTPCERLLLVGSDAALPGMTAAIAAAWPTTRQQRVDITPFDPDGSCATLRDAIGNDNESLRVVTCGDIACALAARALSGRTAPCDLIGIGLIRAGLLPPTARGITMPIGAMAEGSCTWLADEERQPQRINGDLLQPEADS